MVELREFVRQALCDISRGVLDAQEELAAYGVKVNPQAYASKNGALTRYTSKDYVFQTVEFDIAITATQKDATGGGFAIAVVMASLKFGDGNEEQKSSISRIRFQIPLDIPHQTADGRQNQCTSRSPCGLQDGI